MNSAEHARLSDLFERRYEALVKYVKSLSSSLSMEDARDVAQETFIRLLKSSDQYRGEGEWTYLRVTAHNLAMNLIRDRRTGKYDERKERTIENARDMHAKEESPESELVQREQVALFQERLRKAMDGLPAPTRRCVLLRAGGRSYEEIAQETQLTADAAKSRVHDAKKRLREEVGPAPDGAEWPEGL